jgi:phosphoserine aminotransferase
MFSKGSFMSRVYNFSAGPATLPLEVLQQAKEELLDWHDLGMSVMEISHRSKAFMEVAEQAESDLRELLAIPNNYKVLFLQGGARSQFAMVPMNLLAGKESADYVDSGIWSGLAIKEAARYCTVNVVASSKDQGYITIPPQNTWAINPKSAYFHYVDNETVNGVEFPEIPEVSLPLVSDMSSNILSRPFDVSRFALVYAGAQKNVGPAGLTIVIVREDLLGKSLYFTPSMFNYELHAKENSLYNTPPTFSWYMAGLTFKWLKERGGLAAMAQINQRKSSKLYQYIDQSDFYHNPVNPLYRSRMNVIFCLKDESINDQFLKEANDNGLANLKGHKLVGAMRASIYNALPEEAIDRLIDFMKDFSVRWGH